MSLILRHKPEVAELKLDKDGWVDLHEFVRKMQRFYSKDITEYKILEVVRTCDKQRYTLSNTKPQRIRANQGHSVELEGSTVEQKTPPDILYHGTSQNVVNTILKDGIKKMSRIHVHLTDNIEIANKVGARHGKPVILIVDAKKAHENGVKFYISKNNVWLSDYIDSKYIQRI